MTPQHRILFITLSNIGDLVMTTPLLEALHAAYPAHVIDIVADSRSSALLRACPYRGRILHREKQGGAGATLELIRALRESTYDVAVDLRTAFLTLLVRCGQRGVKRRGTSHGRHAVHHHFTALRPILGADTDIPSARLWLDDAAREAAARLLGGIPRERTLVVAPGANWPGKIWPASRYAAAINLLRDEFDHVLIVGAAGDRDLAEAVGRQLDLPYRNLAGATDLPVAAACMSGTRAFLGNDSGLGHMAAALAVPTLTVFGPGDPERYRPWGEYAAVALAPDGDLEALAPARVATELRMHLAAIAR